MSFTAQVPSWAEWAPPIPVLRLGHAAGSGFLCRNDVLILSANPKKIVCRISREATQIGCWCEQIPSEIIIKVVDKSCHSPLWWTAIRHAGRGASEGYKAPISRAVYALCMRCSMQSFGLATMCADLTLNLLGVCYYKAVRGGGVGFVLFAGTKVD